MDDVTHFNSTFKRADWNPQTKTYNIQFEDTRDSKQKYEVEADVLISAIGGFSTPLDKPPGLKGLDRFHGESFHSARWNHSIDLKGKKVGVIGNGCSAGMSIIFIPSSLIFHTYQTIRLTRLNLALGVAQFIPELAKDPSIQIVNFVSPKTRREIKSISPIQAHLTS